MKQMIFALAALLTMSVSASAMSYEQARNEALFLTDKMAYELNLTDAQYEAAYEINLDYLMGVTSVDDVYGPYWERRNLDLSYILYTWQWDAFIAASYFYRPLYWNAGYWHFGIYARYPHRDYFFYGRPHFYATYRGGHSWHMNGGHSYYHGRSDHFRPALPRDRQHFGMRDGFNRGDYRNVRPGSSTRVTTGHSRMGRNDRNMPETRGNNSRSYDNNRNNNRGTLNGNRSYDNSRSGSGRFSGNRSSSDLPSRPSSGVNTTPNRSSSGMSTPPSRPSSDVNTTPSRSSSGMSTPPSRPSSNSFSGNRSSSSSAPARSFGNSSSSSSSRSVGSRASSSPSRSFGSSHSSSSSTRSSGGSSSSRSGGSSSGRSGGHFSGGRR